MAITPTLTLLLPVLGALILCAGCATLPGTGEEQGNTQASVTKPMAATMPRWQVGDHWVYDDGYELKVTETANDMAMFVRLDEKNRWMSRRGFLILDSFDGDVERKLLAIAGPQQNFYPLEVGKSAIFTKRYLAGNQERIHQHSWLVEGREQITVPAGTFNCWVILFTTRNTLSNWRSFDRWWYSPEVNHYVRLDYQYGDSPMLSRKLTSHTHDQPAPSLRLKLAHTLESSLPGNPM